MNLANVADEYREIAGAAFLLSMMAKKIWINFENAIKYESRFFPNDAEICNAIESSKKERTYELRTDHTPLFRARVIRHGELANIIIKDYFDMPDDKKTEMLDDFAEAEVERKFEYVGLFYAMLSLHFSASIQLPDCLPEGLKKLWNELYPNATFNDLPEESLIEFLHDLKNNTDASDEVGKIASQLNNGDFWGFNSSESGVAPIGKTSDGRANAKGISYLYIAESIDTAIAEVRPIVGQLVSVAEIKITSELKLLDLCQDPKSVTFSSKDKDPSRMLGLYLLNLIAERFAYPNYVGDSDYYVTQYICELLKTKYKYHGVRFKSSLHSGGVNIALFNNVKCNDYKVENSLIYKANDIAISHIRIH